MARTHLLLILLSLPLIGADTSKIAELRNLGLAQLENEQPQDAEATYRKLAQALPNDPMPHANLAVAALRQQKHDEALAAIDTALKLAPERPDLLAIRAATLTWSGDQEQALEDLVRAGRAGQNDVGVQYALFRQATTVGGEAGEEAAAEALTRLSRLRPENALVLLQLGQRSVAKGRREMATRSFLRLRELAWQAPDAAGLVLDRILESLEKDDLEAARIPALRLENVLKITPMYQQSLRELSSGILGIPVLQLADEPAPVSFGEPLDVRFSARSESEGPAAGLAAGDLDGDGRGDLAWLRGEGDARQVAVRRSGGTETTLPAVGVESLLAADLDNDGRLDLIGFGPERARYWRSDDGQAWQDQTSSLGLEEAAGDAAVALDFDIEGDLDLVLAGSEVELWRNALDGPLTPVGERVFPAEPAIRGVLAVTASDADRDGDLDLIFGTSEGLVRLDNLRQGQFRRLENPPPGGAAVSALVSVDLNADGFPDLATVGSEGLRLWKNQEGDFQRWPMTLPEAAGDAGWSALRALDADNDGELELALGGQAGVLILRRAGDSLEALGVSGAPKDVTSLAVSDLDADGDLDLAATAASGLHLLENEGGNENRWLSLRLHGLDKGNSKNNVLGFGSTVEVLDGLAYQFREADADVVHLGLGNRPAAAVLRVVWTNGVPQNRIDLAGDRTVVEEQLLKGSCPFLYAWDGDGFRFVTDLLWGAPLGMPIGPGAWAGADPDELVRVDGLRAEDGRYRLRLTEELWEAAYFDRVRLWVVDHPEGTEAASNLRILPGDSPPDAVLTSRELRPPVAAWDGRGQDSTAVVMERDEVYAAGFVASAYQGIADEAWSFTFDLGSAPGSSVRLHLDGWVFPADASLNLAVAQRSDHPYEPTRLEVETPGGWIPLLDPMGFPPGKTKTMVVDTPPLPAGARRLRIVSRQWLAWDRVSWTTSPADEVAEIRARLEPERAELRYRGFSEMVRTSPNGPHHYRYDELRAESPWLAFPGRYTRFGDVRELLLEPDDRLAILAPGDEIALEFDASDLPAPRPGWRRTLFLESVGWDKDADRNTWAAERMEPLPFHAMGGYPYPEGVRYPDTEELKQYQREWLTREIPDERGRPR